MPEKLKMNEIAEIQARLDARAENSSALNAEREMKSRADTSFALADEWEIGSLKLKAPSICVVMLLQASGSPFLDDNPDRESTLHEIIETLFILKFREQLAPFLFRSNEQKLMLAKAEKLAEKSPAFFEVYMKQIEKSGNGEYEMMLSKFSDALGEINLPETIEKLKDYISRSVQAFTLLPSDDTKGLKKNK